MKKLTKDNFIERSRKVHGNKYDYSLVEYRNNKIKVKIVCPEHGIFEQRSNDHMSGYGCNLCAQIKRNDLKRKNMEWFEKCNIKFNNKFDYSLVDYITDKIKVKIVCPEHGIFEQRPLAHFRYGCKKCNEEKRKYLNCLNFINKANKIHNRKYDYSLVKYKDNKTKVKIFCPEHGIFEQRPDLHLNHGCFNCCESRGEKKIKSILSLYNIKFEPQYRFDMCKNKRVLPFDFYLVDYNLCIEYDGEQHFIEKTRFGGKSGFLKIKTNDIIKSVFCKNNKINLLRIKYVKYDQIENILIRFLKLL